MNKKNIYIILYIVLPCLTAGTLFCADERLKQKPLDPPLLKEIKNLVIERNELIEEISVYDKLLRHPQNQNEWAQSLLLNGVACASEKLQINNSNLSKAPRVLKMLTDEMNNAPEEQKDLTRQSQDLIDIYCVLPVEFQRKYLMSLTPENLQQTITRMEKSAPKSALTAHLKDLRLQIKYERKPLPTSLNTTVEEAVSRSNSTAPTLTLLCLR